MEPAHVRRVYGLGATAIHMVKRKRKLSKTHHRRSALRSARLKTGYGGGRGDRAYSCSSSLGDDFDKHAQRYEAEPLPRGGCIIHICNRVFRREALAPILMGCAPLEAAATMLWLGTNKHP